MEGVSERQKAQLGRRVSSKMTEEQQWYTIFDILFPGAPRPISPYVDTELTEELAGFQDFLVDRGPALLTQFLRQRGENTSDLPQEERDLASFQETVLADGLRFICERWADDSRTSDDTAQSDVPSGAEQLTETGLVISSLEESLAITRSTQSYIQNAELFGSDGLGQAGQAGHSDTVFPYIAPHGANLDQNGTDMPWSYEAVFNTDFHFDLDFSQPEIFETRKI
ncbi:hypothetical protein NUW58_g10386 [Xylaria curta]|uniref:Uncharacterized protein n=1 Tax=Xylaria curta TaxID=42375 RepID=A0ACC1MNB2_9PEZI|nr:hypothetical protein NUW58_g10386 [Xylaria curta]